MSSSSSSLGPSTTCVHTGTHADRETGGVCSPIFTSSAYAHPNPTQRNVYPRYFNVPNQQAVVRKLAALEKGEDAPVFGSGMAAISTVLLAHLAPGEHAVFQADLYGGTLHLIHAEMKRLGIQVGFARTMQEFESSLRPATRVIYVESPSNPLLRCVDLRAIADLARSRGILSVIDNTFASPINQNPLELGIDVAVHSGTKYLNGHSDLNAGAAVSSRRIIQRILECATNLGGMLDSHACYQLERGLKTLALRVRAQNANAGRVAEFLEQHPAVARVYYPGLRSHPDHAVARGQMRGFGGMLAFELREAIHVDTVLKRFSLVTPALSLGGVESLICAPSQTSHRNQSAEERLELGIRDGLLRVSVGIEDGEDLLRDFEQALGS